MRWARNEHADAGEVAVVGSDGAWERMLVATASGDQFTIEVYDDTNTLVASGTDPEPGIDNASLELTLPAGDYSGAYSWNGTDDQGRAVTSGTYFFRLETAEGSRTIKGILIR